MEGRYVLRSTPARLARQALRNAEKLGNASALINNHNNTDGLPQAAINDVSVSLRQMSIDNSYDAGRNPTMASPDRATKIENISDSIFSHNTTSNLNDNANANIAESFKMDAHQGLQRWAQVDHDLNQLVPGTNITVRESPNALLEHNLKLVHDLTAWDEDGMKTFIKSEGKSFLSISMRRVPQRLVLFSATVKESGLKLTKLNSYCAQMFYDQVANPCDACRGGKIGPFLEKICTKAEANGQTWFNSSCGACVWSNNYTKCTNAVVVPTNNALNVSNATNAGGLQFIHYDANDATSEKRKASDGSATLHGAPVKAPVNQAVVHPFNQPVISLAAGHGPTASLAPQVAGFHPGLNAGSPGQLPEHEEVVRHVHISRAVMEQPVAVLVVLNRLMLELQGRFGPFVLDDLPLDNNELRAILARNNRLQASEIHNNWPPLTLEMHEALRNAGKPAGQAD